MFRRCFESGRTLRVVVGCLLSIGPLPARDCDLAALRWVTGEGSPIAPTAVSVPDWDGDGVREIVVASSTVWDGEKKDCEVGTELAGVYSGRTRRLLATIGQRPRCVRVAVRVLAGRDLDGDGVGDLFLCVVPEDGLGRVGAYSAADGRRLFEVVGEIAGDRFGWAVAAIDDVDGDGVPDFAVGSPLRRRQAGAAGEVIFGAVELFRGAASEGEGGGERLFGIGGVRAGESLGFALSSAGRFDDSGSPLLVVGAPSQGAPARGSVQVLDLSSRSVVAIFPGVNPDSGFGSVVLGGGDTDGDGFHELIFSAPWRPRPGVEPQVGRVFIARGRPRGDAERVSQIAGAQQGASFGQAISFQEDSTGDGAPELLIGAPSWSLEEWARNVGRIALFASEDRSEIQSFEGTRVGQYLGVSVTDAGDVDGNGIPDVLFSGRVSGGTVGLALLGDRDGDGVRDVCEPCTSSIGLGHVGGKVESVARTVDVSELEPRGCVEFTVDPGRTFRVRVKAIEDAGTLTAALRWGAVPTTGEFDAEASGFGEDGLVMTVSPARDEVAHLAFGVFQRERREARFDIVVEAFDGPIVEAIYPAVGSRDIEGEGSVLAVIEGAGFSNETRFWLEQHGGGGGDPHLIDAVSSQLYSPEFVEATFNLSGAPRAFYDLHAMDPSGAVSVAQKKFAVVTARNKRLYVSLTGTGSSVYRLADQGELTLRYANIGDTAVDAPIFRIRETQGTTEMRVGKGEEPARVGELLLLGSPGRRGRENKLAPGEEREVKIFFREIGETRHELTFIASVLRADRDDFIDWSRIENPDRSSVSDEVWRRDLSSLSLTFGRTWREYAAALGEVGRRFGLRGEPTSDVAALFRFSHAHAQGRPRSAIEGRVIESRRLAPVSGVEVVAIREGVVLARTMTDREGRFVLRGLPRGERVRLRVDGYAAADPSGAEIALPSSRSFSATSEDVFGVELRVSPGGEPIPDEAPGFDDSGLASQPLEIPEELFTPLSAWRFTVVGSKDPNAKEDDVEIGEGDLPPPQFDGEGGGGGQPAESEGAPRPRVHYTVFFENSRCITAAARRVTIVDTLVGDYFDLTTLEVGTVNIGLDDDEKAIAIDQNLWEKRRVLLTVPDVRVISVNPFRDSLPECLELEPGEMLPECDGDEAEEGEGGGAGVLLRDEVVMDVQIEVRLEGEGPDYELIVTIDSCLDGECLEHEGFLPPNDCETHHGEGYVTFSLQTNVAHSLDEIVENRAAITFDNLEEYTTEVSVSTNLVTVDPDRGEEASFFPLPKDNPELDKELFVSSDQTLSWQTNVLAREYRLEVWKLDEEGERFALPVHEETLSGTLFVPDETWEVLTTFEWQVTAVDVLDREFTSSVWTFRTDGSAPPPPVDDLKRIAPEVVVDLRSGVVLDWDPSSSADEFPEVYSVRLWSDPESEGEIVAHVGAASSYEPQGLAAGVEYSWQIVAVNGGGETEGPVWTFATVEGVLFRRGDVNQDTNLDVSDAIAALNWLFLGAETPGCVNSVDFDDNGVAEITDPIAMLNFLFSGGPGPKPPGLECGVDPSAEPSDPGCQTPPECAD